MTKSKWFPRSLLCASLILAAGSAQAGGTKTHKLDEFDEFDDGEVVGAAIETSGRVTRGYASERADLELSSAFTCVTDGKQAWVGTADNATIQQVDLRGGTPAVKQLVELEGVVVSAIARLPSQDLVVAVLPGSKLLRVDKNGEVSDFAELKDVEQIWAIVPHKGKLLVATGPKGELWSVGTDGKDPKVVLDVPEKDILSVLAVGDEILVGTSPKSRLYKLDAALEGVLLHEFKGDEIRALALSGSTVIAAVNKFEDRSVSSRVALTKQLNRSSLTGEKPEDNNTARSRADADAELWAVDLGSKRDVLRAQDAAWDKWFAKGSQYFIDLIALDDSGTVLAASSEGGRIYRARGRRDVSIVADLEERQATSMCRTDSGDILATASDGAAVYLLSPKAANAKTKPRWVSEVLDADHPARYGSFALEGKGKLELRVRSGPTEEVDDRWSAWKPVKLASENGELRGSTDLPQRRYLQVEVALGDDSAELSSITAFYAPENLAPLVEEIDVKMPSVSSSSDEEPDPTITIEWDAEARDDDDLLYEVAIRRTGTGDDAWVRLNKDGPLTKKEIKLDLDTLADGIYEVQVIASDEPSNGAGAAARDSLISEPFVIDRRRPTLENVRANAGRITGVAKDQGSYVRDVAFSIDGGAFRSASASDGLYDSSTEQFELVLPSELGPGLHRVVVRARDVRGNLTTVALEVGG
ncbi:hypothetical protein [Enhygromyxa salina]|uniref:Fibronectin type-III domain-containing protein n=1 Tax=Enhygromyxa salina TaxID=215803 RepID=A0A2S9XPV5_9BACT|nr:hypothetical protein [Enhygromyxa salina]PRP94893.1 hypothetical protein ENSA7_77160 [Enhygromyxa salina]